MPRKARHMEVLEDSKKEEFRLDKDCKKERKNIRNIVSDSREDEYKMNLNLLAISYGYPPPNVLSYQKN